MTWRVVWTGPAVKDIQRLDAETTRRVYEAVDRLSATGLGDLKRLLGRPAEWRLRIGKWRVILRLDRAAGPSAFARGGAPTAIERPERCISYGVCGAQNPRCQMPALVP